MQKLEEYLTRELASPGPVTLKKFGGGYSNLTYDARVGDREVVVRTPPDGRKAATAHDMAREFRVLKALREVFPLCPEPYLLCEDLDVMGKPFYVMQKMPGAVMHKGNAKKLKPSPAQVSRICESLIDTHAMLHKIDPTNPAIASLGKPEGYARRQLEGWIERYRAARTPNAPKLDGVIRWLETHLPKDSGRAALVHNDFKLDNVLFDPGRDFAVTGVLDWEMTTIGDPLMDLGCSLAYWVEKTDPWYLRLLSPMATTMPGSWTRAQLLARYGEKTGLPLDDFDFYYVFGLFRIAGIAQQIYYRYYHKQTRDRRFRTLVLAVYALEATAKKTMKGKR